MFKIVNNIYEKYKPEERKNFINYSFVLKKILILIGKTDYDKYILPLKTTLKRKKLEGLWDLVINDPEWAEALQKQKIF